MEMIGVIGRWLGIALAFAIGLLIVRGWIRMVARREQGEGTIERISPGKVTLSRTGGGPAVWRRSTHTATISFEANGRRYEFDHDYWPDLRKLKKGESIPLLYEIANPRNVNVNHGPGDNVELKVGTIVYVVLLALILFT